MENVSATPFRILREECAPAPDPAAFELAIARAWDGVLICDERGTIRSLNPAARRLFGHEEKDAVGRHLGHLIAEPALPANQNPFREKLAPTSDSGHPCVARRKDGTTLAVRLISSEMQMNGRHVYMVVAAPVEETDDDSHKLRRLIAASPVGLAVTRVSDGSIIYANDRLAELFGKSHADLVGRPARQLFADPKTYFEITTEFERGDRIRDRELELKRADGDVFWALLSAEAVALEGAPTLLTWVYDISEQKRERQRLAELAVTDSLTGIGNRRHFLELAEREVTRSRRTAMPLAAVMIDIDHFKWVNDSHGHAGGDAALCAVAEVCRQQLRAVDVLGRLGGEEFGVLLVDTGLGAAIATTERLRRAIAAADIVFGGAKIAVTASFGLAAWREGENLESLLARADGLLYTAKNAGRDRVVSDPLPKPQDETALPLIELKWSERYASGHDRIDADHRALFDAANRLVSLIVAGAEPGLIANRIDALLFKIVDHFRDEENLMAAWRYGDLERHRAEHQRLLARARDLTLGLAEGRIPPGEVLTFLTLDLVSNHILKADRAYFPLAAINP